MRTEEQGPREAGMRLGRIGAAADTRPSALQKGCEEAAP